MVSIALTGLNPGFVILTPTCNCHGAILNPTKKTGVKATRAKARTIYILVQRTLRVQIELSSLILEPPAVRTVALMKISAFLARVEAPNLSW